MLTNNKNIFVEKQQGNGNCSKYGAILELSEQGNTMIERLIKIQNHEC